MPERETKTIKSRGTVTIDVEHCKGCDLCIPACPPGVLAMSTAVNHMGYRYPELHPGLHRLRGVPATCAPTSCSRCSGSSSRCSRRCRHDRDRTRTRTRADGGLGGAGARARSPPAAASSPATR